MRKVITYGTFDLFHKGHYNILKRAKDEGDYLIVGVTGEQYDAERGKLSVKDSLATRIENVRKTGFADKIIVEEYLGQKIADIVKYDIDVIVIGSDWKGKFDHLNKYCEVKYLERTKNISSTQIREEVLTTQKFGIATDDLYDNDAVVEPKLVSGIHVESVYSDVANVAEQFCEKYELDKGFTDYDAFLDSVDIVYIKVDRDKRYHLIKRALQKKKHVISDAPCSLDPNKECELYELSQQMGVSWLNNIITVYLQAFGQLLWNARCHLIGDIVSIRCGISKSLFDKNTNLDFIDLAYYPVCVFIKILGIDFDSTFNKVIKDEEGNITHGVVNFAYKNAVASAEISMSLNIDCGMVILGTEGTIIVPSDWWRIGYFKIKLNGDDHFRRYSFNFQGNGFRYLVQSLLQIIDSERKDTQRLLLSETVTIIDFLSKMLND